MPEQGFELQPGLYTLSGRARLNLTYCRPTGSNNRVSVEPLKAIFEAGKKYYVGLDHSSKYRKEWHYVIWKIENQEGEVIESIDEEPFDFDEPETLGVLDG
ncbi:MAG: hypothetical protein GWM87_15395 [Xanthomonadales bacterium]|nr:hypothetical protein [Xanthomonadales bacterium]NIX14166.1 hypothetical protein [Xanthomonadales bacterium]